MNSIPFETIKQAHSKPQYYEKSSTKALWTNPHIAEKMLEFHLNPETDAASYKLATIDAAINWIHQSFLKKPKSTYLDLGCGPGLYTSRMAEKGVTVTGVDFSKNSIQYAKTYASEHNLSIEYLNQNYLHLDLSRKFDLITLIWCDICVLSDQQLKTFLQIVKNHLGPKGLFLFDFVSLERYIKFQEHSSWLYNETESFYASGEHLVLENHFKYNEHSSTCSKYTIIKSGGDVEELCLWHRYYSLDIMTEILESAGFVVNNSYNSITGEEYTPQTDKISIVAGIAD